MQYHAYGGTLSSELPLPELEPASPAGRPLVTITATGRPVDDAGWLWLQPRPADDEDGPWVAIARRDGDYRVIFDTGAQFVISPVRPSIAAHISPDVSPAAVRHRLIDQVVPLLMSHAGRFVLHASAVLLPQGAVAFVGPAGAGKSTMAASFAGNGAPVVADDALVVERVEGELVAVPAYAGVRVWPHVLPDQENGQPGDHASSKRRLGVQDGLLFSSAARPLRRIYVLRRQGEGAIAIGSLPPRETIMALISHAFVLDVSDRKRVAEQFERAAQASADMEVRLLTYPHQLSALADVRDAIRLDVESR